MCHVCSACPVCCVSVLCVQPVLCILQRMFSRFCAQHVLHHVYSTSPCVQCLLCSACSVSCILNMSCEFCVQRFKSVMCVLCSACLHALCLLCLKCCLQVCYARLPYVRVQVFNVFSMCLVCSPRHEWFTCIMLSCFVFQHLLGVLYVFVMCFES